VNDPASVGDVVWGASLPIRRVGDVGLLIEAPNAETVQRLSSWIGKHPLKPRLREVIPGARTVFICAEDAMLRAVATDLRSAALTRTREADEASVIVVDVRYDGPDLPEVAERLGMSGAEVIQRHACRDYTVEFFGFAPGQAFLSGLPSQLRIPRRETPRIRVPAGALAIANEFSVIYPRDSPGGWNLIGTRLSDPLWNIDHLPPNRVQVGDIVRFRACP
jgi:KipI family sensor histidine kinase inhibitor